MPKDYGTLDAQVTYLLKVEFLATGEVGKVVVLSGFPVSNLTDLAVEAAKKIKFKPAQIDGKPVTSIMAVVYSYSYLNGGWTVPKKWPGERVRPFEED